MTDVWTMQSREDEIEFCEAHGIHLPFDASHSYSRDRNLWHISHEGLELEDPSQAPNYDDMLVLSVTPEKAPDKETEITMTFEQGVPKTLNGKAMKVSEIITELNKLGGENGIGIVDIVENRVVGMKSRGVYETPGGTILMAAHEQLEELTLDRETMETKKKLGSQFAQVVYEGKWYTPLREAIQAFVTSTQKYVTGALVEGELAALDIVEKLKDQMFDITDNKEEQLLDEKVKEYNNILSDKDSIFTIEQMEEAMQKVMDAYAGGISSHYQFNENCLNLAKEKINNLITLSGQLSAKDYHELMFYYELKERLTICLTLIEHLKARKETRWHSFAENLDHPQKSDDWKKYVNTKKVDGKIKVILRELVKEDEHYEHQN